MKTKKSQEGYLMVDHRASPGLPEEVAIASGYDPKLAGEGKLFESATLTCAHCKVSVVKNLFRIRARSDCPKCDYHYICDGCAYQTTLPSYSHLPYDKLVDLTIDGKLGTLQELLTLNEVI
jgi:hypothetical protein